MEEITLNEEVRPRSYRLIEPAGQLFHADCHVAEWSGVEGFVKAFRLWSVRGDLCENTPAVELLLEDLGQAANLSCGLISQILNAWWQASSIVVATEHTSGRTLADLIRTVKIAGRRLPLTTVLTVLLEAARALEQAHDSPMARGPVVHGDLRPEYVLLGYEGTIKITGFGFGRFLSAASPGGQWCTWGGGCYQPPDRLGGDLDPRMDIHALGVMLLEAATDVTPHGTDDPDRLLARLREGAGPLPDGEFAAPEDLRQVILRACAPRMNERYSSAEELAAALHGLLLARRCITGSSALVRQALEAAAAVCSDSTQGPGFDRFESAPYAFDEETTVTEAETSLPVPFEVHELAAPPAAAVNSREVTAPGVPFMGRSAALDRISQALSATASGRGSGLLLVGEQGCGRTRILSEISRQLSRSNHKHAWLQVQPRPSERAVPFGAVLRLLAAAMGLGSECELISVAGQVERLRSFGIDLETRSTIQGLLGLGGAVEPDRVAGLLGQAAVRCLASLCWEQTTVLAWDDLQWTDEASMECLAELMDHLPATPVLVLLTAPVDLALEWGAIGPEVVELGPLTVGECQALILARAPGARAVAGPLLDELVGRSGGNPLLVLEQTDLLREAGRIELIDGELGLRGGADAPFPVLEDAVRARLDSLGGQVASVAVAAALAGPGFTTRQIATVVGTSETEVEDDLDRLVSARVLRRGQLGPRFPHERLRRAVEDWADRETTSSLGRAIAAEMLGAATEPDCGLADHAANLLARAGDKIRAAEVLAAAARRQEDRGDPRGAAERYGRAMVLTRTAGGSADDELRLCMCAGEASLMALRFALGQRALERALELASGAEKTKTRAEALVLLCRLLSKQARLDEAQDHARAALPLAEATGDDMLLARAHAALAESYQQRGEFGPDQEHIDAALRIASQSGDLLKVGEFLQLAVMHAVSVGDYDGPRSDIERARAIAAAAGDHELTCRLMRHEALLFLFSGEPEVALGINLEGIKQARRHGLIEMEIVMLHNAGDDHLIMGNMEAALYYFNESLRRSRAARFNRLTEANEMFVGFVEAHQFDADRGFVMLQAAIDRSRDLGRPWNLTQGYQLMGRALMARGDLAGAVEHLQRAVRIGEQAGIDFFTEEARKYLRQARSALP